MNNYVLHTRLGSGSFGDIWSADSDETGISTPTLAVKLSHYPFNSHECENEHRGTSLAASLPIPGIIPLYELGELYGRYSIAMKLGSNDVFQTSEHTDHNSQQSLLSILATIASIATTLDILNDNNIIHGSLSPNDIVFCDGQPLLTDFTLLHRLSDNCPRMSQIGVGSWCCMSPEMRAHQPSRTSDQYSLCMIYLILRIRRLPNQHGLFGNLDQYQLGSKELAVIRRASSVTLAERYKTCTQFVNDLTDAIGRPV